MKFPKYWARGVQTAPKADGNIVTFTCWQWSDESMEDAQRKADSRARTLAEKVANDVPLDRYGYDERPLREETLESIRSESDREIAVITRNSYGAQILNSARAMFIDMDFGTNVATGNSLIGQIGRLFGRSQPTREDQVIQQVTDWAMSRPELTIRLYRTKAGLRGLITSHLFDPVGSEAQDILRSLPTDGLYIRLCRAQECFRARLTPKPWRIGVANPPPGYPFEFPEAKAVYRDWLMQYQEASQNYTACRFVTQIGGSSVHPEVRPILNLHDRLACSPQHLELA
jgi:hypothetical protein